MRVLSENEWNYQTRQTTWTEVLKENGIPDIGVVKTHNNILTAQTPEGMKVIRSAGDRFAHTNFPESHLQILDGMERTGIAVTSKVIGNVNEFGLGTQFRAVYEIEKFTVGNEEFMFRYELVITYDGTGSTQIIGHSGKVISVYRKVCSNGLHKWVKEGENATRVKYRNTINNVTPIQEAIQAVEMAGVRIGLIKSQIEREMNTMLPVSKEEAIALCMSAGGFKSPFRATQSGPNPSKEYDFALETFHAEGFTEPTLWGVQNAVTKMFTAENKVWEHHKDLSIVDFGKRTDGINNFIERVLVGTSGITPNRTKFATTLKNEAYELMNPKKLVFSEN